MSGLWAELRNPGVPNSMRQSQAAAVKVMFLSVLQRPPLGHTRFFLCRSKSYQIAILPSSMIRYNRNCLSTEFHLPLGTSDEYTTIYLSKLSELPTSKL
jgi:hypothetical protein